jgi:hypothetical protein
MINYFLSWLLRILNVLKLLKDAAGQDLNLVHYNDLLH